MKIKRSFYTREDVTLIARELPGKFLFTKFDGVITGGFITEAEAYAGVSDRASHAFGNRRTKRTRVMYQTGGTAYVYLCYGVHSLFNIVTNKKDVPHAVLIRGICITHGTEHVLKRTGKKEFSYQLTNGPGKVSGALGIHYRHTGIDLLGQEIWLEDLGLVVPEKNIQAGPRIGVGYAGDDAALPYRYYMMPECIAELGMEL